LRRLAAEHAFYELPGSELGAWDDFSTRNIGLKVNRRMARECNGKSEWLRKVSTANVAQILGVNTARWTVLEQTAFENFAVVLAMVPGLKSWTREEKQALVQIIRAKAAPNEMRFLHLMQNHGKLRAALLKLGS
ncbi:MAG TPA: hypothetical protein VJ723_04515, partial [Candidatus Angelobacter sp.]|nr:hypothetical protein [Candidatus Angelobacter sp.]